MASRDTPGELRYVLKDPPRSGDELLAQVGPGFPLEEYINIRNQVTEVKTTTFVDARTAPGGLKSWTLDTHGFMVMTPPPAVANFRDRKRVKEEYYPKMVETVRQITGAKAGYMYQYLTRDEVSPPSEFGHGYSRFCHSDFGPNSPPMMRRFLIDECGVPEEEVERSDMLMANVWFPKDHPAYRDPFCLLDATSVKWPEELMAVPISTVYICQGGPVESAPTVLKKTNIINAHFAKGNTGDDESLLCGPSYSPSHRWVFCPDMKPEEAWLFKQFDTRENVARQAFHNSFHDPFYDKDPSMPQRRSCEFRMVLLFPKPDSALQPQASKL